ncbi:hypothetical protein ACH5RR_016652 [Cinchona calisaya]|uniref:ABC transmembrane type-1 domain-containing protein n=1 Tax=Cinchona calisaya TaxID=153742 RepID=A0ABD3A254_9GENT
MARKFFVGGNWKCDLHVAAQNCGVKKGGALALVEPFGWAPLYFGKEKYLTLLEPINLLIYNNRNIIYARHNASEAEMKEVARIANAHHFISSLPHGYDTHVRTRGVDLTLGKDKEFLTWEWPASAQTHLDRIHTDSTNDLVFAALPPHGQLFFESNGAIEGRLLVGLGVGRHWCHIHTRQCDNSCDCLIGMLLQRRLALVALAILPVLMISAVAQKLWLAGFLKGVQEIHRKALLVLEDAVRNVYTVVAFCADKAMNLYWLQLRKIFKKALSRVWLLDVHLAFHSFFFLHAMLSSYGTLPICQESVHEFGYSTEGVYVFLFPTFAFVEPFGLASYILKRRKSLTSVFEIIDRVPKIDPDDYSAMKPPNVYGSIELRNVSFRSTSTEQFQSHSQ